jgi:hypothetical protein
MPSDGRRGGAICTMGELIESQAFQQRVFAEQVVRIVAVVACVGAVRLWHSGCVQHLMHAPQRWCHHQCQCQPPRHPRRAQLVHAGKNSHVYKLVPGLMAVAHAAVFAQRQTFAAGLQLLLAGVVALPLLQTLRGLLVRTCHATVAFNVFTGVRIECDGFRR